VAYLGHVKTESSSSADDTGGWRHWLWPTSLRCRRGHTQGEHVVTLWCRSTCTLTDRLPVVEGLDCTCLSDAVMVNIVVLKTTGTYFVRTRCMIKMFVDRWMQWMLALHCEPSLSWFECWANSNITSRKMRWCCFDWHSETLLEKPSCSFILTTVVSAANSIGGNVKLAIYFYTMLISKL